MAWGIFNKIKQGLKKAWNFGKKVVGKVVDGAKWVNEKVVKPFKPMIKTAINTFIPGAGAAVDVVSDGIEAVADGGVKGAIDWGRKTFNK